MVKKIEKSIQIRPVNYDICFNYSPQPRGENNFLIFYLIQTSNFKKENTKQLL